MEHIHRYYFHSFIVGLSSVIFLIVLLEIVIRLQFVDSPFAPLPSSVLYTTYNLLRTGILVNQILASLCRIAVGYGLGLLVGLIAAVLCSNSRFVEYVMVPFVDLIRCIAPLALLPVFLFLFGIGFVSKVAIIFWVSWVPVFLNTFQGMKSVDQRVIKAARSIGLKKTQIAIKVILPSAAPFIIAGMRLGIGSAFLVLVAAEMIGANSGLGFYILETSQTFKIKEMYSAIIVIAAIGFMINFFFVVIARELFPWSTSN